MERLTEAYIEYYLAKKFGDKVEAANLYQKCKQIYKEEELSYDQFCEIKDMVEIKFY